MALLFIDGFDTMGTSNGAAPVGLLQKWANNGSNHNSDTVITGRFSNGMALRPGSDATTFNHTNVPIFTAVATLVCGVAFRIEALPSSAQFRELMGTGSGGSSGTTIEVGVAVNSSGGLRVYRGSTSTSLGESSASIIEPNKWYYLELNCTHANSPDGSFEVRLDGVNVVSAGSVDTLNSAIPDTVRLFGRTTASGQNQFPHYDDFYVLNTSGSPSDFLGPRHIYTIFPSAAGDSTQFTPNTGSNFQAVDDNGHDGNTTYIESNVENNKDLYQFGDLGGTVTDITAAAIYGIVTKTDVSAFDFIGVAKSNGDEADAAADLVNPSSAGTYEAAAGFFLTDPDTAAAWTQSGINAAQFGLKVGF